jgi:alpha-L-fucosidase
MSLNGRSIYGAGPSEFVAPPDCRITRAGDRLYVHLFAWPVGHLHLKGLAGRVEHAQLLHDGSEIRMQVIDPHEQAQNTKLGGIGEGTLTLELPVQRPPVTVPVIELFLREPGAP